MSSERASGHGLDVDELPGQAPWSDDWRSWADDQEIDTFDRDVMRDWGISDALFVNGKEVCTGPPPSFDKIRRLIRRRAKRISG